MQKIIVIGNLGKDPEYITTKGGGQMLTFNIAANRNRGEERTTTWYRVKSTSYNSNYFKTLKKGSAVIVTGDLFVSAYTDKNGAERSDLTIWANAIEYAPNSMSSDAQTGVTRSTNVAATVTANVPTNSAPAATPSPTGTMEVSDGNGGMKATTNDEDLPF